MESNKPSLLKRWKWGLIALALMAGLVAAFYAEEDIRGGRAWRRFKTQWEAKGEKFDFAAFIPPPVPDERNFAMTPLVASCYSQVLDRHGHMIYPGNTTVENLLKMPVDFGDNTNGTGDWQKARCINLEAWQKYYWDLAHPTNQPVPQNRLNMQYAVRYGARPAPNTNAFPVPATPRTPAADVLLALSKYDATIEKLRQAAALPGSRFPLNYDTDTGRPDMIWGPHLETMGECTALLQLRALAELEAGQSEPALADVGLMLGLIDKIRSEPFLLSQQERVSMLETTAQPIWEGLVKHRWQDAQLAELERRLATFDFVADFRSATRSEIASQVAVTEYLRRHPREVFTGGNDGFDRICSTLLAHCLPSGWFYRNELCASKILLEEYLPAGDARAQTISPALLRKADASVRHTPFTPFTIVAKSLIPSLMIEASRFAYAQAIVNLSRTSCALERYRLAHGNYPATLDMLAPQCIAAVPHDPIGGQPLHYQTTDRDHFLLYSIGWNERDDGGTVSITAHGGVDPDAGDWVWRSPE
jgi:hypothetical protein